jgi:molybdopterin/thiamine biosynthesis adenylyltransferase
MGEYDRPSRSRLAGYQPDFLFSSHALIVGAGAVGQSLALEGAHTGSHEKD